MAKEKSPANASGVTGYGNKPLSRPAHALAWEAVAHEVDTNTQGGLTASEAQARLDQYGRNDIGNASSTSAVRVLLKQVANAMTFVRLSVILHASSDADRLDDVDPHSGDGCESGYRGLDRGWCPGSRCAD